ncbi:ankyrin repeat-containing protein At5g02620-like isoform X2 [Telopea speciosissima]|uniref:ankyrin repeat-containing protein At5g02620-like isoform X2 n=1 Tax=Telopea speciosissima TaxID=54955 RepID=UPI001CC3D7B1|nr:ankyrin repeat-containing protein At5g02620-like isoform X2 [Telopea speciosissima]
MDSKLYNAAAGGDIKSLEGFKSSELLQVTRLENTILHVAVQAASARYGAYDETPEKMEAKIGKICDLCPSHIGRANLDGDTPLHIAARGGRYDIVELLISKYADIEIGSSSLLLKMVNSKKDTALHEALKNHHLFDRKYQQEYLKVVEILINKDPQLSNFINDATKESPVFIAAREGLLDFLKVVLNSCCSEYGGPAKMTALHAAVLLREEVLDIIENLMRRKPDLIEEEDEFELTPLHYAANLHSDEKIKDSHERVKKLLDPELASGHIPSVIYRSDKNGMTALHYAALRGDYKSIDALIQCCPDCFEQVDKRGWTTLHFAVKAGNDSTIKSITKNPKLGSISMFMVNKSDKNGDTPLHLAAKISNLDALRFLMDILQVDKRALNKDTLTALDILKAKGIDDILEKKSLTNNLKSKTGVVSSQAPKIAENETKQDGELDKGDQKTQDRNDEGQVLKKKDEDIGQVREIQLLVATLIATVSFAATFTMPGGYNSDGPDQGMATLSAKAAFIVFAISNTLAMALSTSAIFVHFNATTTTIYDLSTDTAAKFIILANTGMVIAFVTSTYLVLANNRPLAISTTVIGCLFFLVVGGKLLTSFFKYCVGPIFCNKCCGFTCLLCCCLPFLCCFKGDNKKSEGEKKPVEEKKPLQSSAEEDSKVIKVV